MSRLWRTMFPCAALAALVTALPSSAERPARRMAAGPGEPCVAMRAMEAELERSVRELKGEAPMYYLAYALSEVDAVNISAEYGALTQRPIRETPVRSLRVSVRVGDRHLDNTHKLRDEGFSFDFSDFALPVQFPAEDDVDAMRAALWRATDREFKAAQKKYQKVKTKQAVLVEEEDTSDDFSAEQPHVDIRPLLKTEIDREAWAKRIRALSARFKKYDWVVSSSVGLQGGAVNRCFVSSEGARIQGGRADYRVTVVASAKAEDGMELFRFEGFEAPDAAGLPTDAEIEAAIDRIAADLAVLRAAPVVEPYAGPAILSGRAAAVFFHEIFGHRIEGHRQKDEDEGQTFTKKVGQKIMPEFITIIDDPTQSRLDGQFLLGHYAFDDEGVPAQKVLVVENGVLRNFLMGRSPVKNFPASNGHGRAQGAEEPVARQGNLIVSSSHGVPEAALREMLIAEACKQGKPFGLIFEDIAGGFTITQRFLPQAFKVMPLVVRRVYTDGRPDEVVRGVDIVGTPLASLENILATSDRQAVFNGYCGAESGFVPVSACAPSFLVSNIEVEKREKKKDRPPILPPPLHDREGKDAPAKRKGKGKI
jgi:TldD protein